MSTISWRLRIRDAADTTDVLVVSSVRGDTHPDAIDAPSGDGAEFDPVTGSYRSGSMTFRIADSITSGTSRIVTSQLEDATYRQQLTSRPAYIEESVNGGAWNVIQAGIITGIRLASAAAWEIDVGDATRATRNLVAFAPKRNATDATKVEAFADYLARWPTRGCIAGGPILGGFLGRTDLGGWEMKVTRATTWNGVAVKALEIDAAYFPSDFGRTAHPSSDQIRPVDDAAGPAATMPLTQTFADDFKPSPWPDLIVKVGANYYACASFAMAGDTWFNPSIGGALIGTSRFSGYWTLYVFDPAGTLPAVGTTGLRMSIFDALPSDRSKIFYQGHPLDLWTKLCDESALRYDATAVAATKALLGNNLRITLEINAPQDWASFVESALYGPCGFSVRTATDGTLVPYTTRTGITALPSVTITNADVPQDGSALFDLSEPDAITKVTFNETNLSHSATSDENLPLDGLARQSVQVIRTSGDAGGPVQREQSYTIPGFLDTGSGAYEPGLVDAMAKSLFDRFGRGRLTGEVTLLRAGAGGGVVLGQEIIVGLRAMPNHNKRIGDDGTVGGRCVQVVRLTPGPSGPRIRFVDSGPNAQPASPLPVLSLAAGPPGAGVALTITNAATLNAASPPIAVRVQWASVPSGSPAAGDYTDVLTFGSGAVPTGATLLPLAPSGSIVFVRARSEDALHRPSAYTTPISSTPAAMGPPTGLSVTVSGTDASRATVAWTTGTNAGAALTDILLRLSSLTAADNIRMAQGLLAGTISYPLTELVATLSYTVTVRHRDAVTGATTEATFTFTAGSTLRTLSAPTNPHGFVGDTDPGTGVGRLDGTYGLYVTAVELPGFVTFWEAVETGVGTGTYGAFTQVSGLVPSVSGGPTSWRGVSNNALLRKQLQARHEAPGTNPSTYTSPVTLDAWGVVLSPPPVEGLDASGQVTHPVPLSLAVANVPAIDPTDGHVDPGVTLHGTSHFIPRATDVNGLNLAPASTDSRARLLNTGFQYAVDGAVGVVESAAQKFIHGSYVDGSRRPVTVYDPTLAQDVGGNNLNVAQLRARTAINSSNRLATGVEKTADVGGLSAHLVSRSQPGGVFRESFEEVPSTWPSRGGGGTFTLGTGVGLAGGNVGVMTGTNLRTGPVNIPFDPSKLHRIRFRVQQVSVSATPGADVCYLGLVCYAADGVTQVDNANGTSSTGHYLAANGIHLGTTAPLGTWQEVTAFFKGTAVSGPYGAVSPNANAPAKLAPNTRYFRPYAIGNYTGVGDGVVWVDEIVIDVLEESGTTAVWTTLDRTTPGQLLAAAADSRASLLNGHFRYGTDTAAGVVETGTLGFIDPTYTSSRKPSSLWDPSGLVARTGTQLNDAYGRAIGAIDPAQNGTLLAAGKDSRGRLLNTGFQYGTDTAVGVVETAGQRFVNGTALDGSRNVDFSAAGVVNRVAANVNRVVGGAALSAVVQQLTDTGHAGSAMQDSRASLIGGHFRLNVDSLDAVVDSATYTRLATADVAGHSVYRVTIADTRAANSPPSAYSLGVTNEFKDAAAIGIPGGASSNFGSLRTEKPWPDSSGGNATQTFSYTADNRVWKRTAGAGAASWGTWRILTETATQRVDRDTGHADSTMQDSRASLLNGHFRYGTDTAVGVVPTTGRGFVANVDGSNLITPSSSSGRSRCRAVLSTAQTLSNNLGAMIPFGAEDYNVNAIHSTSSNQTRITIPSGGNVGAWIFIARLVFDPNATGDRLVAIYKNNGASPIAQVTARAATLGQHIMVSIIEDSPTVGDYYEVLALQTSGGNLNVSGGWFSAVHLW